MDSKKRITNILKTLILPVSLYILFAILNQATGRTFFTSSMGWTTIIKNTIMAAILAYGIFFNLMSFRFDFSVGSVWLLSGILSFNIAANLELNPWLMLVLSVLIGAGLSLIIALVYLLIRASALVLCLGMLLVYESLSMTLFEGRGATISSYRALNVFGNIWVMIAIFAVVFVIMYIINNYTAFGYHTRALAAGQKIAVKIGIKERINVVWCWIISGACAGLAVVFQIVSVGNLRAQVNFGTSSTLSDAFLPCFLGAFLARYSENTIGVLVATFSVEIIKCGLNALQLDSNLQSIINIMCLLIFVIYSSVREDSALRRALKARAAKVAGESH